VLAHSWRAYKKEVRVSCNRAMKTYKILNVHFTIKVMHHRDLKVTASLRIGVVRLQYLIELLCEKCPELVNQAKVPQLFR
jgi:hypothetical protein